MTSAEQKTACTAVRESNSAAIAFAPPRKSRPVETDRESRDFAYSQWGLRASLFGAAPDLRTVRTKRTKLTLERNSGAGELYDLGEDPHEMHNRFDDPAYERVRRELESMIASRPRDERRTPLPQVGMA